jgi:hypothetical protein
MTAPRITHVGTGVVLVADHDRALAFYTGIEVSPATASARSL